MQINATKTIDAPAEALWAYIADYGNIHRFHPLLKGSHYTDGAHACEVGATRQCDMKDGNFLRERITDWKAGSHYTVEVYETSMPVTSATATLGVRALGENRSEAYMQVHMVPKYKIMQPMMFLFFRYVVAPGILKGLEKMYQRELRVDFA